MTRPSNDGVRVERDCAYRIHTVLTDNGIQFTNRACDKYAFHHIFDRVCDENGIEHRLTKVEHPWTKGQSLPRQRPGWSG